MALTNDDLLSISNLLDAKLDAKLKPINEKVSSLDDKFTSLDEKIRGINLHLGNVTDRNISIIAENHINLSGKLDEAIKGTGKDVMTRIQVNILTEKVEKLEKEIVRW